MNFWKISPLESTHFLQIRPFFVGNGLTLKKFLSFSWNFEKLAPLSQPISYKYDPFCRKWVDFKKLFLEFFMKLWKISPLESTHFLQIWPFFVGNGLTQIFLKIYFGSTQFLQSQPNSYKVNPIPTNFLHRQVNPIPTNGSTQFLQPVFSMNDPKQNARSLLTSVADPAYYALPNGSQHFFLHGSSNNRLFQSWLVVEEFQPIEKWLKKLSWRAKPRLPCEKEWKEGVKSDLAFCLGSLIEKTNTVITQC